MELEDPLQLQIYEFKHPA